MISCSQRSLWLAGVLALAGMALPGCGDDAPAGDGGVSDAGRDSGRDAATSDASMDDASMDDGGAGTCGDGVIEGVEACDDGEENSDTEIDACRTDCTLAACGDDVADTGEICDGDDLLDRTCVDESFMSGVLRCATDCSAFDTTMCSNDPGPVCGDAMIEGTEECDGAELGGATCPSGGTLSCTSTCTLDMSACTVPMTCGNDIAEGTEACDGTDLRAATCVSRGFTGGALACTACAFDETACTGPTPGPTTAGQIVITEVMQNPAALGDNDGEWFELHNPGAAALNLNGCVFTDGGTNTFTVGSDVMIAAGGYATFAKTQAAAAARGFTPDYEYPAPYALANGADSIVLTCGGTMIDTVAWDGGPMFPSPNGATMSLSPSTLTATANDDGGNWCEATSTYGAGAMPDRGTPGAANDVCVAAPVYAVTFCRLQSPTTITADIATPTTVYGRVYALGLTDVTDATDVSPSLLASVGYGPDGTDPATSTAWTWTAATPNTGWNGATAGEADNDEYQATLLAPAPAGAYDFAYRFSGDSGATWVHCDSLAPGSSDGYQIANAGQMTTTALPVTGTVWINELHYDDAGGDADEGIEVAGTAGTDLTGYTLVPYNGNGGGSYDPVALTGTIPDQSAGFGTVWVPMPGLQNGAPDGVALVDPLGAVIAFLCYEGTFAATGGAAMGTTCVDIGVLEIGSEADGMSLQLTGTGTSYSSFTWTGPVAHTRGMVNAGQIFN